MKQTKLCTDCNTDLPLSDFYNSKTHSKGKMCYCKKCFNKRCISRWINRKLKAINYKNSQCEKCGLHIDNSHYSVFDFHHKDPTQKDFDWAKLRLKSWTSITNELDKCQLLCANCHRIVHSLDFPEQVKSH